MPITRTLPIFILLLGSPGCLLIGYESHAIDAGAWVSDHDAADDAASPEHDAHTPTLVPDGGGDGDGAIAMVEDAGADSGLDMDASAADAGPDLDGGMTLDPDGGPERPNDGGSEHDAAQDAGDWWSNEDPDQVCGVGQSCSTLCPASGRCYLDCDDSTSCQNVCAVDSECRLDCERAGTCSTVCSARAACSMGCKEAESCNQTCAAGATCDMDCRAAGSCNLQCALDSSCAIDCREGAECIINCAEGAQCAARCDGGCMFMCEVGGLTCNDGWQVCGQDCPG